jgi:hypothetical protein
MTESALTAPNKIEASAIGMQAAAARAAKNPAYITPQIAGFDNIDVKSTKKSLKILSRLLQTRLYAPRLSRPPVMKIDN